MQDLIGSATSLLSEKDRNHARFVRLRLPPERYDPGSASAMHSL